MSETKRRPKDPPGERFPRRLPFYDNDEGMALLQEMARQDGCSAAALMRRLIREEAAERGVGPALIVRDPERCAGSPTLAGTRTAVHDVVSYARHFGGDLERVRDEALPHLSLDQVRAAIAWFEEHTEEIEEILRRRREFYESLPEAPTGR